MPESVSILFQTGFILVAMSAETAVEDQVRRRQNIMGGAPRFSHEARGDRGRPESRWEVRGRSGLLPGSGFGGSGLAGGKALSGRRHIQL